METHNVTAGAFHVIAKGATKVRYAIVRVEVQEDWLTEPESLKITWERWQDRPSDWQEAGIAKVRP